MSGMVGFWDHDRLVVLGDTSLLLLFGVCWAFGCVCCLSPLLDNRIGPCDFWRGLPPSALIGLGLWYILHKLVMGLGSLD
jgi:hypothetical protein